MRSGKKAVNCIPCAKRKVRCDKEQPCSHCKRRKQDVCAYPSLGGTDDSRSVITAERIETLEGYIRSLGRDPLELYSLDERSSPNQNKQKSSETVPKGLATPISTAKGHDQSTRPDEGEKIASLVKGNNDAAYIEACEYLLCLVGCI